MRSVIAVIVGLALLAQAGAALAEAKLLVNSFLPPQHIINSAIVYPWARDVERVTEGRVKIEFPATSLAPPPGQWEVVTQGIADGAYIFNPFAQGRLLLPQIAHLPFQAAGGEAASVALWRTYKAHFEKADEYKGVAFLGYFGGPPGHFYSMTDKPLTKIEDFKDLKVWSLPNAPSRAMAKLGASVVPGPAARAYEIISKGIVDAHVALPYGELYAFNIAAPTKSATELPGGFFSSTFSLFLNEAKWKALPEKDRALILSVSGETLARRSADWDKIDGDFAKKFEAEGRSRLRASDAFVSALKSAWSFLEEEWLNDAKKRGIDGPAALAYYRDQQHAVVQEKK